MALTYGTSTAITITAGGLTNATSRSSAAVTTGVTNNVAQILLTTNILSTSSAPTGAKCVLIYGYMSEDGTNYLGNSGTTDNVDGTDKGVTLGVPSNLTLLGSIRFNQGANAVTLRNVTEITGPFGCIPPK